MCGRNEMMNETVVKNALWEDIRKKSKSIESGMDPLERKRTGSYYTALELTDIMMSELVSKVKDKKEDIWNCRFLEPCVGAGNFVFSYIKVATQGLNKEQITTLLNNIYAADINPTALKQYEELLRDLAKTFYDIELSDEYFVNHIGSGLLIDVASEQPGYLKITDVFPEEVVKDGFDIVVTNPPYKNLKAEKGHYINELDYEIDKEKYATISKIVSKKFKYSTDGVLNLYKIFVEEIIDQYTSADGYISLLIPASIMSDKTCAKLRTHILVDSNLISVKVIEEGSGYIDAQQALCAVLIQKGKQTVSVNITKDYSKHPQESADVRIEDVLNENNGNSLVAVDSDEYEVLKKLRKFPTVKELDFITNLRGELDLTANKQYIVKSNTGYPLLRGRNIGFYNLIDTGENEYVSLDFIESTKKKAYILKNRIICQQIANMHKERRVTFAYVDKNEVLGNSCNFIAVLENEYGIDIYSILGLFNSSIINWFFKLTSSNNHINNYEIDCFPVPVHSPYLLKVSKLVQEYFETNNEILIEKIEQQVQRAYGLDESEGGATVIESDIPKKLHQDLGYIIEGITYDETKGLLDNTTNIFDLAVKYGVEVDKVTKAILNGICDKYTKMYKGEILNHSTFKLSDLDLEMIKSVPPGGSWKDIPTETVVKSKRLKRISETGGRTTLYGRIDYDKPSYTITTYFNRPGNGTYVHPSHERVISVREAARFQCFKDDYYFHGNKTQLLKQVGNAVPTVLAYQIAKQIVDKTSCRKSIDLFCGAGGMTAGFKAAGIQSIMSNDIEESACITLKINNPEIEVHCGDITEEETKEKLAEAAKLGGADIICGGPPCQGFSMAGLRLTDDPRNQLFKEFIDIVIRVNPKVIVFENVEGLLSYQNGQVYQAILSMFAEIGYKTEGRTLMTNDYGVPQKRKRVIIICTRSDLNINPADLFPNPITIKPEQQITARDTVGDLDKIECGEDAKYINNNKESDILQLFKGEISYEEYISRHTDSVQSESHKGSSENFEQLTFAI